jgi:hypothetical protein
MEGMLGKTITQGLPNFQFGGKVEAEHPGRCGKVGNGLKIPDNNKLFGHGTLCLRYNLLGR